MMRSIVTQLRLWSFALLASLMGGLTLAQPVDPALAASWKFVQETMPDLPYDVLNSVP